MPLVVSFRGEAPRGISSARPSQRGIPTTTSRRPPPLTTTAPGEPYICDFYENIWEIPPPHSLFASPEEKLGVTTNITATNGFRTMRRRRLQRKHRLVDIAQVSHVLTTVLDYRSEYPPFPSERTNIWAEPEREDRHPTVIGSGLSQHLSLRASMGASDGASSAYHSIVSPIQSQENRGPQSAPHFRMSFIDDGTSSHPPPEQADGDMVPTSRPLNGHIELSRSTNVEVVTASTATNNNNNLRGNKKKDKHDMHDIPEPTIDTAVPPPSTRNGSVVFSSVFVEKLEWSWSIRFLLGVHEPIRHALYVMDRFLEQSHMEQQIETLEQHTNEFFLWFKTYFVEFLKCQHDVKVRVLHPLIQIKYSTKQEILRTYDEIHHVLAQIQLQEHALLVHRAHLDRAAWLLRLDTLQKAVRRLNMTLHAVLNLEEKTLHPALSAAFTEKTFHSFVLPRLFRAIKAKKVVVPWIVERSKVWGGAAEQQSFQGMLPFSAKFLYKKIWRPYFMSNVAVAMKNLNEFDLAAAATRGRREGHVGCIVQ